MMLPDVNVLVCAFREDAVDHERHRAWLDGVLNGQESFGSADLVLSGFLRIVTSPAIFSPPTSTADALAFAESVRSSENCVVIEPGKRHWSVFTTICEASRARGNLIPDAYLAALAIESGSEWVTMDGDYARFPGLRWRQPF